MSDNVTQDAANISDEQALKYVYGSGPTDIYPAKSEEAPQETPEETVPATEAEASEPEVKEEAEEVEAKTKDPQKAKRTEKVPHGALLEERNRRREAEQEVANLRKQLEGAGKAQQEVQSKAALQVQQEEVIEDPIEYLKKENQEIKQKIAQTEEDRRSQVQLNQFLTKCNESVQNYQKDVPDYQDAYMHARNQRVAMLKVNGLNDPQAQEMVNREELQVAAKAYQDGVNPAERIYELAKVFGYKRAEVAEEADKTEEAEHKLREREKNVNANKSLSSVTGSPVKRPVGYENLTSIKDEDKFMKEFNRLKNEGKLI